MKSSTRSFLRGLATKLQPIVIVGKYGITDNVIAEINEVLEQKELVKITVLKNSLLMPQDVIKELADKLKAEPVASIGSKVILYRRSKKKDINHIILPE